MKKVFSIFSVLILFFAGLPVTISSHYCWGERVAAKISLSGIPASCGMENNENKCPFPWDQMTGNCCENRVRIAAIVNIFTTGYPVREDKNQDKVKPTLINSIDLSYSLFHHQLFYTDFNPPGDYSSSSVCLENICVLRI